jgi:hypothetical protein
MFNWLQPFGYLCAAAAGWGANMLQQYLAHHWSVAETRKKFFREKLVDLYSEFAALIAIDIDHAKDQRAQAINTPRPEQKQDRAVWVNAWTRSQRQRQKAQRKLYSLSFQVRLLEQDKQIAGDIQQLAGSCPFVIPLGDFDRVWEILQNFEQKIVAHEKQFHVVCDKVLAKYGAK